MTIVSSLGATQAHRSMCVRRPPLDIIGPVLQEEKVTKEEQRSAFK